MVTECHKEMERERVLPPTLTTIDIETERSFVGKHKMAQRDAKNSEEE